MLLYLEVKILKSSMEIFTAIDFISLLEIYLCVDFSQKDIDWLQEKGGGRPTAISLFKKKYFGTTQILIMHANSHPYEYRYADPTPMSIFED